MEGILVRRYGKTSNFRDIATGAEIRIVTSQGMKIRLDVNVSQVFPDGKYVILQVAWMERSASGISDGQEVASMISSDRR